jgi:4-amino-4-deoxy-L-arabinose transferase
MSIVDGSRVAAVATHSAARPVVRTRWLASLLLSGIAASYVTSIAVRPLVAPDEFRYTEIPREMIATRDWVVPRLDGVLYFEKPPLGYWLTALSLEAFGEHPAAARLPGTLATLLTAAIAYALVRHYGAGASAARFTGLGLLTCVELAAIGTGAVLDAMFALGVTATLAALFVAAEHPPGAARQRWLAACGASCGAAFLTKGFLAFAIPIVVAVPYLIWSRRSRDLWRLPWTPLAIALAVAAPWAIAIARSDPDFWPHFVWYEHLRRFTGADAPHPEPFWFFLPVIACGALPWFTLLVPALRRRAAFASSPLLRLCVCWLVAPVLLLSASSGKLATYALPCFPPLFMLIGDAALAMPRGALVRHLGWIARVALVLALLGATVLVLPIPQLAALFAPDETWKRSFGALAALAVAGVCIASLHGRAATARVAALAGAFSLLLGGVAIAFPTAIVPKTPERWLAERVAPIPGDAIVVTDRVFVAAVCWQLHRADIYVVGGRGELRYGLRRPDQRARRLDAASLAALIRDPARTRPVVVIARAGRTWLPEGIAPSRSEIGPFAYFGQYDAPEPTRARSRSDA